MARISGVDLPKNKQVQIALTYVFGIGNTLSSQILAKTKISPDVRVKDLSEDEILRLRDAVSGFITESLESSS